MLGGYIFKNRKEMVTMAKTKAKYPRCGYWFRCLREAFHITQAQIAYEAEMAPTSVSNFEIGKAALSTELTANMHKALIDLVHKRAEVYGNEKTHVCMNIAKLRYAEYFEAYDAFIVSVWATETDTYELDDALTWNGITKWGDWL